MRWFAVLLLLSAPLRADDLAGVRKIAALVEPLDPPDIAGCPYVQYHGGSGNYVWGWLLDKRAKDITVLDVSLRTRRLPLGSDGTQRGGSGFGDNPPPGAYVEREFKVQRGPLAVSLHCALQLGREDLAVFWARARRGDRAWSVLESECRSELRAALRVKARHDANEGASYDDLIELWKRIAPLDPARPDRDEWPARRWIEAYRTLMAERKPVEEETPEYWIFRLRDCAREFHHMGTYSSEICTSDEDDDAYARLVKLGWDALPALVAATGDGLPTRCIYTPIRDWYEPQLAARGFVCRRIIEEISGERVVLFKSIDDWWKEASSLGRANYFEKRLRSAEPEGRYVAACALLPEHLELVWEVAEACSGCDRGALLHALAPHVTPDDRKRLAPMLHDPDALVCLRAAELLEHRCGTSAGRAEVIERLRHPERDNSFDLSAGPALAYLAQTQDEALLRVLLEFIENGDYRLRDDAIACARWFPHPKLAAALLRVLDDASATARPGRSPYRDEAAGALAAMLGYPRGWESRGTPAERQRAAKALRTWVENTKHDWEALRRAARERIDR